ncbi:MAG: peptide chain release factor N(5)-glutamine methyltransferase [Treponema sp.]|jgi:release factor glutamine methyltransferase|nr:peptide chain release factor N(5)-glutamine methyltransferase [Treponema sp.]
MSCVKELLVRGTARLAQGGISSPALDAALLLADVLGTSREKLYAVPEAAVSEDQSRRYDEVLERRRGGECAAYILGRREFWGLDFIVGPGVLVPRPDTETLVEAALLKIRGMPRPSTAGGGTGPAAGGGANGGANSCRGASFFLLDLCTGNGAVAIALKHEAPDAEIWAADISAEALDLARLNAWRLLPAAGKADNVTTTDAAAGKPEAPSEGLVFVRGDLFAALPGSAPRFTLITANAPYVPSGGIPRLAPEVRREPLLALDGGADGLDLIRRIVAEAPARLEPGGLLLLEADPSQMETIARLMRERGFRETELFRDLAGRERVIAGIFPVRGPADSPVGDPP